MNLLTLNFIDRAMEYVERAIDMLMVSRQSGDTIGMDHIDRILPELARFMEGSTTFELFEHDTINRFVDDQQNAGTWPFILGLQQYVFSVFTQQEIKFVAEQLSFAIAPNKVLSDRHHENAVDYNDYAQSPSGSPVYDNTPKNILDYLYGNPWIIPLVVLGMAKKLPYFEGGPRGVH